MISASNQKGYIYYYEKKLSVKYELSVNQNIIFYFPSLPSKFKEISSESFLSKLNYILILLCKANCTETEYEKSVQNPDTQ